MIRLSPLRRTSLQRVTFPFLVLLAATMIILGKADQVMFESLRVTVADAAAPVLDILSQPPSESSIGIFGFPFSCGNLRTTFTGRL